MERNELTGSPALVFDWGNTLMRVFPQYSGPMAYWPEVASMPGVMDALEQLQGQFALVVATNAADSRSAEVLAALDRAGLGRFFQSIFTAQDLNGARKPQPEFFRRLEILLGQPATELVMVGDEYAADVLGAKIAGWRAVWYNPRNLAAPGLLPLQDGEITAMTDLPAALRSLTLPDYPTCLAWLVDRGAPNNILTHTGLVAAIAYTLAIWLRGAGESVDPVLAHRGGMLHDLAKIESVRLGKERGEQGDHGEMARDMLAARGQPALAEIASRHMVNKDPLNPRRPVTWEQKLVHYADKLAEGARLVPIEERLQALRQRYPGFAAELEEGWPLLGELQQEICDRLEVTPAELIDRLRRQLGSP